MSASEVTTNISAAVSFIVFGMLYKAGVMAAAAELRHTHEGDKSWHDIFLQVPGSRQVKGEQRMWNQMIQRQM